MTKILIDEATVKLVLEALENSVDLVSHEARNAEELYGKYPSRLARIQGLVAFEVAHEKAITALKALAKDVPEIGFGNMADQPAQQEFVLPGGGYVPAIPAQQALDKKAENARELGLDYEPAQCAPAEDGVCEALNCPNHKPAQQEPVAKVNDDGFIVETGLLISPGQLLYTTPQPAQRKPLTEEEFEVLLHKAKGYVHTGLMDVVRIVERHHNIKEQP